MKPDRAFAELEASIEKIPDGECSAGVKKQFSEDVRKTKEKLRPLEWDIWIYRSVVAFLGIAILSCLAFTFFLSVKNTDPDATVKIPEIFLAIGSAGVGALAGLLAPSPARGGNE